MSNSEKHPSKNPLIPERRDEREQVALPGPSTIYQGKKPEYSGSAKRGGGRRGSKRRSKKILRIAVICLVSFVAILMVVFLVRAKTQHDAALDLIAKNEDKQMGIESPDSDSEEEDDSDGEEKGSGNAKGGGDKGTVAAARSRSGNPMMVTNSSTMQAVGAREADRRNTMKDRVAQETLNVSDAVLAKLGGGAVSPKSQTEQGPITSEESPQVNLEVPQATRERDLSALNKVAVIRKTTEEEREDAMALFDAYQEVKDWRELLRIVRNPRVSRPKMENFYADPGNKSPVIDPDPEISFVTVELGGDDILRCELYTDGYQRRVAFLIRGDNGSYALDWESFVHYLPLPWEVLLTERPPGMTVARVRAEFGDTYYPPFEDKKKWASIYLGRIVEGGTLFGYMERDSEEFRELVSVIRGSGGVASVVVGVQYPKDATSPRQVKIARFISRYWLIY